MLNATYCSLYAYLLDHVDIVNKVEKVVMVDIARPTNYSS